MGSNGIATSVWNIVAGRKKTRTAAALGCVFFFDFKIVAGRKVVQSPYGLLPRILPW